MRKLLLLFAFVLIAASRAQAQASTEFHSVVAPGPLAAISTGAAGGQPVVLGPQPTRRCCSRKGALIGAAIGAGRDSRYPSSAIAATARPTPLRPW
jgi:hypothetical protein